MCWQLPGHNCRIPETVPTLRTGVDIIEVHRIDAAIVRHGERFFQRFFTPRELIDSNGRTPSLAARYAAKEAASKALGCGIGEVGWRDIEVVRDGRDTPPYLVFHGRAATLAAELGLAHWSLSISHTHDHAVAFVVAMSD